MRIFAGYLISGTFPVIISFILQKYFNLFGPFKTFFGLIVWYQKPTTSDVVFLGYLVILIMLLFG